MMNIYEVQQHAEFAQKTPLRKAAFFENTNTFNQSLLASTATYLFSA